VNRALLAVDILLGSLTALIAAVVIVTQFATPAGVTLLGTVDRAMAPSLPAGTAVVVREVPYNELGEGDAVAFQPPGPGPMVRRIVEVRSLGPSLPETYFRVAADDTRTPEAVLVRAHRVLGRVDATFPLLGYLVAAASSSMGTWLLVSVLGSLLTVRLVLDEVRDAGRRRPPPVPVSLAAEGS
jgi:signal peptidase I